MNILTCTCKDVTDRKERTAIKKDDSESKFLKEEDITGQCICNIDGREEFFDGVSLKVESGKEFELGKYEAEFQRLKNQLKGRPSPWLLT